MKIYSTQQRTIGSFCAETPDCGLQHKLFFCVARLPLIDIINPLLLYMLLHCDHAVSSPRHENSFY